MLAKILESTNKYDIPIAFLRGKVRLYGQDFISVENILVHNNNYLNNITGVSLVSPGVAANIIAPGIELTGEFKIDKTNGIRVPLWYSTSLLQPVTSKNVKLKTINREVDTANGTLIVNGGLIERDGQFIAQNTVTVRIDSQIQSIQSYYVDHADGSITIDLVNITIGIHNITIAYELVELSVKVETLSPLYDLRINKHFKDRYIVKLLLSDSASGSVTYQNKENFITEIITPRLLYRQIAPELVNINTYTFGFNNVVTFPSNRPYQLFAMRSSNISARTSIFIHPPYGISIDAPWFIRIGGTGDTKYNIGLSGSQESILRKEILSPVGPKAIAVTARNIIARANGDGTIDGILVYPEGFINNKIPVIGFESNNGIIRLGINVPPEGYLVVEYKEESTTFEYQGLQLNPSLTADPNYLIDNIFIIYLVSSNNNTDISGIVRHMTLPRVVDGNIKNYTFGDIESAILNIEPEGLPIGIVRLTDPVDKDYFESFDIRHPGGYDIQLKTLTSEAAWLGEDVDTTGVLVSKTPEGVINQLANKLQLWENIETYANAKQKATVLINQTIDKHKRIGMKIVKDII